MEKVWIVGCSNQMNYQTAFRVQVKRCTEKTRIVLASNTVFQVYVNGKIIGAGPRRNAKGFSIVNEYDITDEVKKQDVTIAVLCVSYHVNSYYIVDEDPFFAGEVLCGANTYAFEAFDYSPRVQKSERYCMQRCFTENYRLGRDPQDFLCGKFTPNKLPLQKVEGNVLINTVLPYPSFELFNAKSVLEWGDLEKPAEWYRYEPPATAVIGKNCRGFTDDELPERISLSAGRFGYSPKTEKYCGVLENSYALYDFSVNKSGFISLDVTAKTDCELYLTFDEILWDEVKDSEFAKYFTGDALPLCFYRLGTVSVVKFALKKGKYSLNTIEPYTLRYLKICVNGSAEIRRVSLILYENPEAYAFSFQCQDQKLSAVVNAAQNTFAQNALDVPSDCPSRERAGWLCDSYFTGRSETLFTGNDFVESNFLRAYLNMRQDENLPQGMLPMCYPADHPNGNYIPNWAMWFIIELYDRCRRCGDWNYALPFREKVDAVLRFFEKYYNEIGLLENLEKWVFVEWSAANFMVNGVNIPSNILYSAALAAAAEIYGVEEYSRASKKLKNAIREYGYDGEFFFDQLLRDESGKLIRTKGCSETCQYYAFYFGVADKNTYPKLYNTLIKKFGPKRDSKTTYPTVYPSNAFIGDFMRLDWLCREGLGTQVLDECVDYFYKMAKRTGTLWEHDNPVASCNHGFTSYVANMIVLCVSGYVGFDENRREPILIKPSVATKAEIRIPLKSGFLYLKTYDYKQEWRIELK